MPQIRLFSLNTILFYCQYSNSFFWLLNFFGTSEQQNIKHLFIDQQTGRAAEAY